MTNTNEVKSATIVYGVLSPKFIHANATEQFLTGKKWFINETLTAAIKILQEELVVEDNPPEPSVEYRRKVALGLFYKVRILITLFYTIHSLEKVIIRCVSYYKILSK